MMDYPTVEYVTTFTKHARAQMQTEAISGFMVRTNGEVIEITIEKHSPLLGEANPAVSARIDRLQLLKLTIKEVQAYANKHFAHLFEALEAEYTRRVTTGAAPRPNELLKEL